MDRHMVKYIIGQRKQSVEADPTLLGTYRWDHSDVFYAIRTWLNQHGWETSVYNDTTAGGADRRKDLYDMIQDVCEKFYHVKRHQIGIFPEDRAVMAYNGTMYAASFDNLRRLMTNGTDIVCVEKQGPVMKMMPFTVNTGVAFIQSQGFISEYGVALARLANKDSETAAEYTNKRIPIYRGHVGTLTDCDSSGVVLGMKIKGATRLGIDLDTLDEIKQANKGKEDELDIDLDNDLELDQLEESNDENTHWKGLKGIIYGTGHLYEELSTIEKMNYREYLLARPKILQDHPDLENGTILEYLAEHRIELNTILAAIKPEAFWNWLKWKLLQVWPDRDYRRGGLLLDESMATPTLYKFNTYYLEQTRPVIAKSIIEARSDAGYVRGIYDDTDGFGDNVKIIKKSIEGDILNDILLQNEMDLALEKIMKNGNGGSNKKKKTKKEQQTEADEDSEGYEDDDYDGNEWEGY